MIFKKTGSVLFRCFVAVILKIQYAKRKKTRIILSVIMNVSIEYKFQLNNIPYLLQCLNATELLPPWPKQKKNPKK